MSSVSPLEQLCHRVHALLCSLGAPALEPFLADWPSPMPRPPEDGAARPGEDSPARPGNEPPPRLPVLRCLQDLVHSDGNIATGAIEILCRHAALLDWRQTYSEPEAGAPFLRNYGYAELLGPDAPLPAARIASGFLLLGPRTTYPRHRHEAEEIYLPLSGAAHWQQGEGGWRERPPGSVIHHPRDEPHAMRTGDRPLLALYVWRSANLNQKARIDLG